MGRDDRRLNDHCKFLNSISTLCFVFRRVRLADGATIKILANPIISYFQMLLENNFDEDIELLSTQVTQLILLGQVNMHLQLISFGAIF